MTLPNVWNEPFEDNITSSLCQEAAKLFRIHQLPESIDTWQEHRKALRKRIWKSIGVQIDHALEIDYHETACFKHAGYSIKNIYYQSRPDFYVTGNLYVPEGEGPFPAIINLHGHRSEGRLAPSIQARGHILAQNGYVCLCADAFGSGERATIHGEYEYHGNMLGGSLMNIGETLMGVQVVDNMRGIDLLTTLDYVDSSKIGATGASGGGNQTMWLTAMDDRILAGMPVVSAGTFESYIMCPNCICELLPEGLTYTEESGIFALVAPRALKLCNCMKDPIRSFFPSEMLRSYKEARKIFQLYECDDKLSYQLFNLSHGYHPEIREAMLGFFDLHLKGIGTGAPRTEPSFDCLPTEKLMVFEKGTRAPGVISIAQYCRKRSHELNTKRVFINSEHVLRENLSKKLKMNQGLKLKQSYQYSPKNNWFRYALETECGKLIPLLLKLPTSGNRNITILGSNITKEQLVETQLIKCLTDSTDGIAIIDLWGSGETNHTDNMDLMYIKLVRSLLWLDKSIMGEWCKDFSLVESFLWNNYSNYTISVAGYKESGVAALLFSAMSGNGIPVITEKTPISLTFSEQPSPDYSTLSLFIPEFLEWGDLSLAALLANSNIHYLDPVTIGGKLQDTDAMLALKKELNTLNERYGLSSETTISYEYQQD